MNRPLLLLASLCLAASLPLAAQREPVPQPRPVVIIGGTVFDGSGAPPRRNDAIVIRDGRIKATGLAAAHKLPSDARLIDATGKWIVPGFIDAAVHLFEPGDGTPTASFRRAPAAYLRAYLSAGVTTVLNIGGPAWTFDLRDGRADDVLSPKILTTGPVLALAAPAGAAAVGREDLVAVRLPASPDRQDEAARLGAAAVAAARVRKLKTVFDVSTLSGLRAAVDAGADAVVSRVSEPIGDDLVRAIVERHVAIVPALEAAPAGDVERQQQNVKRLAEAGAVIVPGSLAGEPGVLHGSSLHGEFERLAGAGLAPSRILLSATGDAARLLGLESGRGRIAEGLAGDVVLLDADPLADIRNARRVVVTVRGGAIYER